MYKKVTNVECQPAVNFKCDYCGVEQIRPFWEYKQTKNHYCSQRCANAHKLEKVLPVPQSGEKKHNLTMIGAIERKNKKRRSLGIFYRCKCDCGEETIIQRNKWGVTKSCGVRKNHSGSQHPSFRGHGQISLSHWNSIITGAKERSLTFNITIEDMWNLFSQQKGKCGLSGVEINLNKNGGKEITASLDRIDSSIGYEPNNVMWVHKTLNKLKMDLDINQFKDWCVKVANKSGFYPEKLDFDQVLITPQPTSILSRQDIDLTENKLTDLFSDTIPIIAANFDTVGSFHMAQQLSKHKLMTCLSKHYTAEQYIQFINENDTSRIFYSMGVVADDMIKFKSVLQNTDKVLNVCIDVAHAENLRILDVIATVKNLSPQSTIMVGNIATPDYVENFAKAGVNIIKTGIGSGAVCVTRLVAGVGVPQLSAIIDCAQEAKRFNVHICSDGGCVYPADINKAFAAGASMVMIGSMLSGTDECEGEWIEEDTGKYLIFYGMSSHTAMKKHGSGSVRDYRASEGRTVKVKHKGPVSPIIQQILGGLRSACTYSDARTLLELSDKAKFIKVQNTHNASFENITVSY